MVKFLGVFMACQKMVGSTLSCLNYGLETISHLMYPPSSTFTFNNGWAFKPLQPSVIRLAAEEQVLLFRLPPNTTHLLQPLDKGPFGSLKKAWRSHCTDYLANNPGKVVTRYEFSGLLSKA